MKTKSQIKWQADNYYCYGYLPGEGIGNHSYQIQVRWDGTYRLSKINDFNDLESAQAYAEQLESRK